MSLLTERLLNAQYHNHEEDCCCGEECCCHDHEEKEIEQQLSEEEIEKIIEEKYSEKDEKTKEFIRKGLRKFGDRFDYSKSIYTGYSGEAILICLKHSCEFSRKASQLVRPNYLMNPCPECAHEVRHKIMIRRNKEGIPRTNRTLESFLVELKELGLEEIYDLSHITDYKNAITPVKIINKSCGHDFYISPNKLLEGYIDCPICAHKRGSKSRGMGFERFKEKAILKHGPDRYFYDYEENKDLLNNRQKVKIKCNKCGHVFWQEVSSHLSGKGCPKCCFSKGEEIVDAYLKEKEILILDKTPIYDVSSVRTYIIPDFRIMLDNQEIWIEYNGIQHYKVSLNFGDKKSSAQTFLSQYTRDNDERDYCSRNGIILIEIPYTISKREDIYDFLDKVLFEKIDQNSLVDYKSLFVFPKDENNST